MFCFVKHPFCFLFLFLSSISALYGQAIISDTANILLRIKSEGKFGYAKLSGRIVISAVYQNASDFTEGLAAVKLNNQFGYIDINGNTAIRFNYDSATPFSDGLALVFKAGVPSYINKSGKNIFSFKGRILGAFHNDMAYITTFNDKAGIINKDGKLIVDTVYSQIQDFSCGRATVINFAKDEGLIDEKGNTIVPLGKYKSIGSFSSEFAIVSMPSITTDQGSIMELWGIIDTNGNLLYSGNKNDKNYPVGVVHDGYVKMRLFKYWNSDCKGMFLPQANCNYQGILDVKGNYLLKDTLIDYVGNFSCGRDFILDIHDNWHIINRQAKYIEKGDYFQPFRNGFVNGKALVNSQLINRWEFIDTNANQLANILPGETSIKDIDFKHEYIFTSQKKGKGSSVVDFTGKTIINPDTLDFAVYPGTAVIAGYKFINGFANHDELPVIYYNKQGEVIWRSLN
jgi:hypothetical protein